MACRWAEDGQARQKFPKVDGACSGGMSDADAGAVLWEQAAGGSAERNVAARAPEVSLSKRVKTRSTKSDSFIPSAFLNSALSIKPSFEMEPLMDVKCSYNS